MSSTGGVKLTVWSSSLPSNRATRVSGGVLMSCAVLQGSRKDSLLTSLDGPLSAGLYQLLGNCSNSDRWM